MSIEIGGLRVPVSVIIPAAGSGRRMGGGTAKQFLPLRGEPVLVHTARVFSNCSLVDEIIIAATDLQATRDLTCTFPKVTRIVAGGAQRQDSVWAALQAIHARPRVICVHDAVRPLLPPDVLEGILLASATHPAQVAATQVKDTIKVVGPNGAVQSTPDRDTLWAVQTPQVFWADLMVDAFQRARAEGFVGTDCASLVERAGSAVQVFRGSYENVKLTTPEDFALAEAILAQRAGG